MLSLQLCMPTIFQKTIIENAMQNAKILEITDFWFIAIRTQFKCMTCQFQNI